MFVLPMRGAAHRRQSSTGRLAIALSVFVLATSAHGVPVSSTYIGAASGDWKVPANWSNSDGSSRFPDSFTDRFDATLAPAGGATVNLLGSQSGRASIQLDGLTVGAGSTLVVDTQPGLRDSSLQLDGDLANDGSIVLRDLDPVTNSRSLSTLRFSGLGRQISGAGTIVFDTGHQNSIDEIVNGTTVSVASIEIGSAQTVTTSDGGMGSTGITFTNRGTIRADAGTIVLGQGLQGGNTNTGVVAARNAGTVEVAFQLDNSLGVIDIETGSEVTQRAVISGGTVQGGGTLRTISNNNAVLDGVVLNGVEALVETSGNPSRAFVLAGSLENNGRLRVNDTGAGGGLARVLIDGALTIDGTGEIVFDSAHDNELRCTGNPCTDGTFGSLTLASGQTTRVGAGNTGILSVVTDNQGTMMIDGTLEQTLLGTASVARFVNTGTLTGGGRVDVAGQFGFRNDGVVAPGQGPGVLTFESGYQQSAAGTLQLELSGDIFDPVSSVIEYDRLAVEGGPARLGGLLDVSFLGGFTPDSSDIFTIVTATRGVLGTFANTPGNLLSFSGGTFDVIYGADFVQLAGFTSAPARVPEPSMWVTCLVGLLLLRGRRSG